MGWPADLASWFVNLVPSWLLSCCPSVFRAFVVVVFILITVKGKMETLMSMPICFRNAFAHLCPEYFHLGMPDWFFDRAPEIQAFIWRVYSENRMHPRRKQTLGASTAGEPLMERERLTRQLSSGLSRECVLNDDQIVQLERYFFGTQDTVVVQVQVLEDFKSNSCTSVMLRKGMKGHIEKIDDDGDAYIRFNEIDAPQRVLKENFAKLSEHSMLGKDPRPLRGLSIAMEPFVHAGTFWEEPTPFAGTFWEEHDPFVTRDPAKPWKEYVLTVHDKKLGWLARLMVFHAIPGDLFLWAVWQYWQSLNYQARVYIGVLASKVATYLVLILVFAWARPWVLAVDPLMLWTSRNRELRVLTGAFVFAPELFPTAQALFLWGTFGQFLCPLYSVLLVVSDLMGWAACIVIWKNWASIYGQGSGPMPLFLLTAYFSCSIFFVAALAVMSLTSPRDSSPFFKIFSVCADCHRLAKSAIGWATSVILSVLLALEGAGHDFCPWCQASWPGPDSLEMLHRMEERCSVWILPASWFGRETCTYLCEYGYTGPSVFGHFNDTGHLVGIDYSAVPCHQTTTTTTTTTTMSMTATTTTDSQYFWGSFVCFLIVCVLLPYCQMERPLTS